MTDLSPQWSCRASTQNDIANVILLPYQPQKVWQLIWKTLQQQYREGFDIIGICRNQNIPCFVQSLLEPKARKHELLWSPSLGTTDTCIRDTDVLQIAKPFRQHIQPNQNESHISSCILKPILSSDKTTSIITKTKHTQIRFSCYPPSILGAVIYYNWHYSYVWLVCVITISYNIFGSSSLMLIFTLICLSDTAMD